MSTLPRESADSLPRPPSAGVAGWTARGWRNVVGFGRAFAAVMARPVGDPRTFSPRYFGDRPLFLGGKAVVLRTRDRGSG